MCVPEGVFLYPPKSSHGIRAIRDVRDSWVLSFGNMFIDREVFLALASEHRENSSSSMGEAQAGIRAGSECT